MKALCGFCCNPYFVFFFPFLSFCFLHDLFFRNNSNCLPAWFSSEMLLIDRWISHLSNLMEEYRQARPCNALFICLMPLFLERGKKKSGVIELIELPSNSNIPKYTQTVYFVVSVTLERDNLVLSTRSVPAEYGN